MSLNALPPRRPAPALSDRARADLRYIRSAMERSERFTAVSGAGTLLMGLIALPTAVIAEAARTPEGWLRTWIVAAAVAVTCGGVGILRKARRERKGVFTAPGRRFLTGFAPPVLAGGLLTLALFRAGRADLLPGMWLLLYGAGVVTGGAVSIPVVPLTGAAFMLLGGLTLLLPGAWGNALLALGFGGFHLFSGFLIRRRYGG